MAKTISDLLEGALDDLDMTQFKRFTTKLTDPGLEGRFGRGAVEGKDRGDIARLLIERFTEEDALEICLQTLRNIGANQTAKRLEQDAAGGSSDTVIPRPNPDLGGQSGAASPTDGASKAAFIDKNWLELVDRATAMGSILDILLNEKVLNSGQYSELYSVQTDEGKMQRLYNGALKASGVRGKAILYDALMKKQPLMMNDLGAPLNR